MTGLSKVAIWLIVAFLIVLSLIVADLIFVICYRQRFRRENSSAISGDTYILPSKELLYFLCWKNQSRVEPTRVPASLAAADSVSAPELDTSAKISPAADGGDDLGKWQGLYGPSRVLSTIREEREDSESVDGESARREKVVSVLESPFLTPCSSPPFYTPSSSPPREAVNVTHLTEKGHDVEVLRGNVSGGYRSSFVAISVAGH